jgi:cytoskeletal protein RodZ
MKRTSLLLVAVFAMVILPVAFGQSTTAPSQDPTAQPSASPSQQTPSQTNPNPNPSTSTSTSPSNDPSSSAPPSDARSFVGSIVKASGKYVLHTGGTDYQLDDQSSAKKYEGKDVKVTGQLDASSNTIRVQSIDPASSM